MKKVLSIFIACMLMLTVFASCKGKDSDSKDTEKATSSSKDKKEKEGDEGTGIKVDFGKTGINLKLPKDFPKDVVPLLSDANIVNVIDNKDSKAMGVTYMTGKKMEDAVKFYRNALKDGEDYSETEVNDGMMIYAMKEGYGITAVIVEYDGDKVSIMLNVGYNQKVEEEDSEDEEDIIVDDNNEEKIDNNKENPTNEAVDYFKDAKAVALPENYPKDRFPLHQGDKVTGAVVSEDNEGNTIYITMISNKDMKEIADYYEKSWGTLGDKIKTIANGAFIVSGQLGKDGILVGGELKDDEKSVEYFITIYTYK